LVSSWEIELLTILARIFAPDDIHMPPLELPPGQQWVAPGKWPTVGERLPRDDHRPWTVEILGEVAAPRVFTLSELQRLPQVDHTVDIHCVTRWSKPAVRFSGVPLAALLMHVQPDPASRYVLFIARSPRGHSTSLPLAEALRLKTLVALSVEGSPLEVARGGPVRVVAPDRYFYKSLKWLERIELLCEDRLGFWESTAGYHNTADPWQQQRYMAPGINKAQARAILEKRDISGLDLRSLDAAGHELAGLVAKGTLLRDASFRRCGLSSACFDGANLSNAHFEGADLKQASFRNADLEGADFSGADLRGACLLGASLLGASFWTSKNSAAGDFVAIVDRDTQIEASALQDLTPEQQAWLQTALATAR
jgi:DMSO/TMAO reductase YedYZ molybdopterin-dependent catalytic subunit